MKRIIFGFLVGVIISAVLAMTYMKSRAGRINTTSIAKEITALNRIESAHLVTESIVESDINSGNVLKDLLFGDKILLVAHGEVIAGIDFSEFGADDITLRQSELHITLPPARILLTRIDNEKTRVYDRRTGLLTTGDILLEGRAREAAEQSIRSLACESQILTIANRNASAHLQSFLKSAGVSKVYIQTQEAPCQ